MPEVAIHSLKIDIIGCSLINVHFVIEVLEAFASQFRPNSPYVVNVFFNHGRSLECTFVGFKLSLSRER
jgi:hypothetical protein